MRCPINDGELIHHEDSKPNELAVGYYRCATCGGHWIDSTNANYISLDMIVQTDVKSLDSFITANCPECHTELTRHHTESIPDDVVVLTCPNKHGYFFPENELKRFKKAQEAKRSFFKLWHVPMGSLTSILLAGITLLAVGAGIRLAMDKLNDTQFAPTQAATLLSTQNTVIDSNNRTVVFSVTTRQEAIVTLHIEENGKNQLLTSRDGLQHFVTVQNLTAGSYTYWYVIENQSGQKEESQHFRVSTTDK